VGATQDYKGLMGFAWSLYIYANQLPHPSNVTSNANASRHFPDKICDQISDAVLDAHLKQDPDAKVACGK